MRLSSDGQFFSNPSFAVLLAQLDQDTLGQSSLLPQSWYDNLGSVPSLEWEYSLRDSFLHFAQPGVYPIFLRMSLLSSAILMIFLLSLIDARSCGFVGL